MTAILLLSCALSSDKRLFSGPETGQEKAEALREFRRSSFGALTRGFPKRTDFSFDAIFSTPRKLRIGTERDDECDGLYTQVVGGSIPSPPTNSQRLARTSSISLGLHCFAKNGPSGL